MNSAPGSALVMCTVCNSASVDVFVEIPQVPIHCNLLWQTYEDAVAASRGDIRLAFCPECGHVFNAAFDPSLMEYTQAYENSLHFSPRFQAYAEALAFRLVTQYGIRDTDVIDIGCGKGDFLAMLCEDGSNRGWGFDPSFVPENLESTAADRMTIIQDFYSPAYASYQAGLITCRHVLEHIQFPLTFLQNVREAVGNRTDTVVFFEVPNVMYTLKDLGIWDPIYEHCSYFSPPSLQRAFRASGFTIAGLEELFGGQFLGIDTYASPHPPLEGPGEYAPAVASVHTFVQQFSDSYRKKVDQWANIFSELEAEGELVAVWGGGSKGVTFLNTLKPGTLAGVMVDINPRKQGMYVAGTGQQVVGPEALREYRPDAIIVMNSIYRDEIQQQISSLGLAPRILLA